MLTIGHPFELLSEVESTSNYIADHPRLADMSEGTAILTYNQTQGRGQRQRQWDSVKDKDLSVSYLFRPRITPDLTFVFNKLIALATRSCIADLVVGSVKIKWPNDIFVEGRKVSGILIEPSWQGLKCRHMIVGIGINVNSNQEHSHWNATSVQLNGGGEQDLYAVFERLNMHLQLQYKRLTSDSRKAISNDFDQYLLGRNEVVPINLNRKVMEARIVGVDPYGRMQVIGEDGMRSYQHGEISIDYSRIIGE